MTFYLILSGWSGLSIQARPSFLRINLGFVQIAFAAFDIEEFMANCKNEANEAKRQQRGKHDQ